MIDNLKNAESPVWEVSLHENNLGVESGKCIRVLIRQMVDRHELAGRVAERLGTLRTETVESVLAEAEEQILRLLAQGDAVKGRLGKLSPAAGGVWDADRRNPLARGKATGKVHFTMDADVKAYFGRALLRETQRINSPGLFGYMAHPSGEWNVPIEPGGIVCLCGCFLMMQTDDEEQGICITHAATGTDACRIPAKEILLIQDKRLLIHLPKDIAEGEYTVTVTNRRSTSSRPTKQLRTATMNVPLLVKAHTYDL